jgi:hypothetical protein
MKLNDYNIGGEAPQTVLLEGDSGAGKTIAACSWPEPLLLLSLDGRVGSAAEWFRGRRDIEFEIFTDFKSLRDKVDALEKKCPFKNGTIILDPITDLSRLLMRYSYQLRGVTTFNEETREVEKGVKGKKKGSIDISTIEDYNTETTGIQNMIADMKIISKLWNKESHIFRSILTAGRKIAAYIPTQFDEIYHCYIKNGLWKIKTVNDGIMPARSSFLQMPAEIDWTKQDLYKLLKQYYNKTTTTNK